MVGRTEKGSQRLSSSPTNHWQEDLDKEQDEAVHMSQVDGPYSWLILLVAFLLNLTMNATAGGMGVIMVELTHHFNVKKSVVIWIGGIMVSVGFMLSFLICWLIKRFGCRLTGCLASLSAAVSLILSSFAESIEMLYVTYGLMLGISVAFYWNIASIIIQQYFEKRRTLAQGTLMSGLSGGLFIWPPVTRCMMDEYGWRGAMLLHAGIQLHGIALCALIRPFPKAQQKQNIYKPIYHKANTAHTPPEVQNSALPIGSVTDQNRVSELKEKVVQSRIANRNGSINGEGTESVTFELLDESQAPAVFGLAEDMSDNRCDVQKRQEYGCGAKCFRALFKVLILYPHYLLFMLAVFMVQTGNVMPYTLTPARADALGIDKHLGALLVTVSAGVSGVCRILCGLLAGHPAINRLVLCGVAGLVGGVLTALTTVLTTFFTLAFAFGIIGVPSAAFMATFGSSAVDIVGKKYVQQAIGLMSVSFGIAQFTTFLGTGWLTDVLGDPKYSFLVFGVLEACGGVIFLCVYLVERRLKRRLVSVPVITTSS